MRGKLERAAQQRAKAVDLGGTLAGEADQVRASSMEASVPDMTSNEPAVVRRAGTCESPSTDMIAGEPFAFAVVDDKLASLAVELAG